MTDSIRLFLVLLVGHALADYPLQGDFLARAKSPVSPIPGVPWYQAMAAHSLIHAGSVAYITGSLAMACLEFVTHFAIDECKCRDWISFNVDQTLHAVVLALIAWITA